MRLGLVGTVGISVSALSCALLASCSSRPPAAPGDATADAAEILQEDLLFEASPDDLADAENQYLQLQQEAISECMGRSGFDYVATAQRVSPQLFVDLSSLEVAETRGFGVVDAAMPSDRFDQADPNATDPFRNTPEYAAALERCTADASQQVQRQVGTASLRERQAELFSAIQADPQVVEATKDWASCAADAGYPFPDRPTLIRSFSARAIEAEASALQALKAEEVRAAVATFPCSVAFEHVWRERGQAVAEQLLGDLWTHKPN